MFSQEQRRTRSLQRLANQLAGRSLFFSPIDLVQHMGAIQAQDLKMACLAIGLRTMGVDQEQVEAAPQ